jgi:hypothetical protein
MSAVVSATTQDGGNLAALSGLTVEVTSTSIEATWSPVTGARGYNFYISLDNFMTSASEQMSGTTYTGGINLSVTPTGTVLYFRVSAYNTHGEGAKSYIVIKTIPDVPTYSINGVWAREDGNVISILGSYGYLTIIDSGWKRVENNGDIRIGSTKFRNINSIGNLTWSAQELSYDTTTYYVGSWNNCTITMASIW